MSEDNASGSWGGTKKQVIIFASVVVGAASAYAVFTSLGLPDQYDAFGVLLMILFMVVMYYSVCKIFGWELAGD
ncbi:hypothetical protein [Halomicrobium salinisoli]|uniref:hypothetical protein n=1 Tax=Halomicrobium salinisoli TaxID=2878391 RepID=UPI001CF01F07|nr:hypothetical protein [Halomicrobium salinisoli]